MSTIPQSATPRTDAIEERNGNVLCGSANLEFARTLERELAATERLRFGADADRRRLRAEVEKWQGVAATMSSEREHNANEAGRLRAENDEMRVQIEAHKMRVQIEAHKMKGGGCQCADDEACAHVRRAEKAEAALAIEQQTLSRTVKLKMYFEDEMERLLEAYIDKLKQFAERAEKAEAALAEWSVLNLWGGTPEIIHEFIKGQQNRIHHCQDLETELAHLRAAIDAAMKEARK